MAELIMDSDASHHITNNINSLSSFLLYEGFNVLYIENGVGMKLHHIGLFTFTVSNFTFHFTNVLHIPTFTRNLLSITKLLSDNTLLIEFSSSSCLIKDRATMIPLLQAKLINDLYTPIINPSIAHQSFLATADL
jgi:hypothetical protein